nr:hypothetical protein Muribac2_690 [uncultured Muribaculaceae bacterium]
MDSPKLYIVAGCNGAGKTTASLTVLPEIFSCQEFVNADEIAKGLNPLNPESMAMEAGRLMLRRIDTLLKQRVNFSIETTLATKSYRNLILKAKEMGYEVTLVFFWLPTVEMAIDRVAQRVATGGHNIPDDVIRRRYSAGIMNLFKIFLPIVDKWWIYDNTSNSEEIANYEELIDSSKFETLKNYGK